MNGRLTAIAALLVLDATGVAQVLPARQYPCTSFVNGMTSGDLDGDGLADLVTVGDGLDVLLHDPAGGFDPQLSVPGTPFGGAVALGHLDGDDALDVVWCGPTYTTQFVSRRLGDGSGGFGPVLSLTLPSFPRALALGDLDGDGDDDVALTAENLDHVAILLGDGSGGLLPAADVPVGDTPQDVRAGDLDADGDLDLATANQAADTLSVLFNDGTATFTVAAQPAPDGPHELLFGDVDEDDDLDILVTGATQTAVLPGNGDGTFGPLQSLPQAPDEDLALADMDGDGWQDLVGFVGDDVVVLPGEEGPFFGAAPPAEPSALSGDELLVLDADDDGLLDVVTGDIKKFVTVLRNLGFGELESLGFDELTGTSTHATTADFNNDGDIDVAVSTAEYFFGGGVTVLQNQHFGDLTQVSSTEWDQMLDVEAGDVDADGDVDLVSTSQYVGIKVQLGDGSGTYRGATSVGIDLDTQDSALGDMDGDGDDDIATCWGYGAAGRLGVFTSDGAGGFTGPHSKSIAVTPSGVKVADLNVDGQLDLVGVSTGAKVIVSVLAFGGTFANPVSTTVPQYPWRIDVGNIDSDGLPDLVTMYAGTPQNFFAVKAGDGAGGFGPTHAIPVASATTDLLLVDMNGDSALDILALDASWMNAVVLVLNDGTGGFAPPQFHAAGSFIGSLTVGDLTGDGRPDAVSVNFSGSGMSDAILVPNIGPDEPWTWLGSGKMGSSGIPMLVGHGTLMPGEPVTLELRGAAAASAATLVIGLSALFTPFKGGVLVPQPNLLVGGLVTDAEGGLMLGADWPAGVASGVQIWLQAWVADAAASYGLATSNGATAIAP